MLPARSLGKPAAQPQQLCRIVKSRGSNRRSARASTATRPCLHVPPAQAHWHSQAAAAVWNLRGSAPAAWRCPAPTTAGCRQGCYLPLGSHARCSSSRGDIGEFMKDVGDGIQSGLKNVASAAESAGKRAGSGLGTGAQLAGQGLEAAGAGLRKGTGQSASDPKTLNLPIPERLKKFKLQLLPNIRMGISWLPALAFNPATTTKGAAGAEAVINPTTDPGMVNATFDLATLVMPDLSRENTFIYGRNIRLPPFLRVALHATKMEGNVEVASGKTEISMEAAAVVHIGRLFSLPPLQLKFLLTTETAQGRYFRCWGTRTQKTTGFSRLAGVTMVPKTRNWFVNLLLRLPAESYVILESEIKLF